MTSWHYLEEGTQQDPRSTPSSLGPEALRAYTAQIRDGMDQDAAFHLQQQRRSAYFRDEQERTLIRLQPLYAEALYSPLEPQRARGLHAALGVYGDLLTKPGAAGHQFGSVRGLTPELAAACLAAATILSEVPASLHPAVRHTLYPAMRFLGFGTPRADTNVQIARACLVENRMLIAAPDGARGLTDEELHRFNLPGGEELDRLEVGYTGEDEPPIALLVLAATAIRNSHAVILPVEGRRIDERRLRAARRVVSRNERLAASHDMDVSELLLQRKDLEELKDAEAIIANAERRSLTEHQRSEIAHSVRIAALRTFGPGASDPRILGTMAELLVAQAHLTLHETHPLPDGILAAIATRIKKAATKDGIKSASQLPGGVNGQAAQVYARYADYLHARSARTTTHR